MTILERNSNIVEDEINEENNASIPKIFIHKNEAMPFSRALLISTVLHPTVAILIWVIIIALSLLGIKFMLFDKPEPKVKDIEFVLVSKENLPINKKTKYISTMNSRAGGIHDPKKSVSEPSPAPGIMSASKAKSQKPQQAKAKKQAPQKPQQAQKSTKQKNILKQVKKSIVPTKEPKQSPPKIAPKLTSPRTTTKPTSPIQIPVPKTAAPKVAVPSGPVTGSSRGTAKTGGAKGATSTGRNPSPNFAPSTSRVATSGGSGRFSSGQYGYGQAGNPGPGNPKGSPGIDAIREPDFGPYMREIERRIKMNWDPSGKESKQVVLKFRIAKDGRLSGLSVLRSSGNPSADNAALAAVQLTAPFKPLPPEFKGPSVQIEFKFDYNVVGASRY